MEETAIRTLAKLEQVLPERLRRRRPRAGRRDERLRASRGRGSTPTRWRPIAGACRDGERLRFAYRAKDDASTRREVEPAAIVHTGYRWYLVAWDLDRDDWRTFRVDRIAGRVGTAGRGTRREVPGGDPAAYVRRAIRAQDAEAVRGRVRLSAPASLMERRVPGRYATVEPDGEDHCVVTTTAGLVAAVRGVDGDARRGSRGARAAGAGRRRAGDRAAAVERRVIDDQLSRPPAPSLPAPGTGWRSTASCPTAR